MSGLPPDEAMTRILVVEDHPVFLKGLSSLLALEPGMNVVSEARDRQQALEAVDRHHPHVVLVDLSLGDDNGLDLIKDILHRAPQTRILVLSMHEESLYSERAWAAGALGFCGKGERVELLLEAVRTVAAGRPWRSPRAMQAEADLSKQVRPTLGVDRLSDRELEVFQLIGIGLGTAEIASRLHISIKTVETYKANLKVKMDCGSAHELRRAAVEWMARRKLL